MLAQSSKCAVCGESFLNTWLECVRFVDAREDLKLNNLSGLIPVRALLCSYRCFNSSGHDYYGVAFPWPQSRPLFKGVCPREVTLSYHVICSSNMLMLICVLIKLSWPINTCKLYTCVFPLNLHQKSFAREIKFFQWYVHVTDYGVFVQYSVNV